MQDAHALADNKVHFGYSDNIPADRRGRPAAQAPRCPTASRSRRPASSCSAIPTRTAAPCTRDPAELSTNSSFARFACSSRTSPASRRGWRAPPPGPGSTPSCWRRRSSGAGAPACRSCSPRQRTPDPPAGAGAHQRLRLRLRRPGARRHFGYRCPIGSHMAALQSARRAGHRRGQPAPHHPAGRCPYGPPYDPARPYDAPRGLVGWFINADIANAFELVMSQWVNDSAFVRPCAVRTAPTRQEHQRPGRAARRQRPRGELVHADDAADRDEPGATARWTGFGPVRHHPRRGVLLPAEHHRAARHLRVTHRRPACARTSPLACGNAPPLAVLLAVGVAAGVAAAGPGDPDRWRGRAGAAAARVTPAAQAAPRPRGHADDDDTALRAASALGWRRHVPRRRHLFWRCTTSASAPDGQASRARATRRWRLPAASAARPATRCAGLRRLAGDPPRSREPAAPARGARGAGRPICAASTARGSGASACTGRCSRP